MHQFVLFTIYSLISVTARVELISANNGRFKGCVNTEQVTRLS